MAVIGEQRGDAAIRANTAFFGARSFLTRPPIEVVDDKKERR
jgi:hypothetical protein